MLIRRSRSIIRLQHTSSAAKPRDPTQTQQTPREDGKVMGSHAGVAGIKWPEIAHERNTTASAELTRRFGRRAHHICNARIP
jgi:hypothetical protein